MPCGSKTYKGQVTVLDIMKILNGNSVKSFGVNWTEWIWRWDLNSTW